MIEVSLYIDGFCMILTFQIPEYFIGHLIYDIIKMYRGVNLQHDYTYNSLRSIL